MERGIGEIKRQFRVKRELFNRILGRKARQVTPAPEYAVLVHFAQGNTDLSRLFVLEERPEEVIAAARAGELDGNEVATDGSEGTLYLCRRLVCSRPPDHAGVRVHEGCAAGQRPLWCHPRRVPGKPGFSWTPDIHKSDSMCGSISIKSLCENAGDYTRCGLFVCTGKI